MPKASTPIQHRAFPPRARHPLPHRTARADRDRQQLRCHPHRPCDLFHHRSNELSAQRARAARPGGLFCVVLADFMANTDPALPSYVHTFFPTASSMRYALALAGFETIFCRRLSGSIFIAARPASTVERPSTWPFGILIQHRTKTLRYSCSGGPSLALGSAIKA